jgi:hypothetical protein
MQLSLMYVPGLRLRGSTEPFSELVEIADLADIVSRAVDEGKPNMLTRIK